MPTSGTPGTPAPPGPIQPPASAAPRIALVAAFAAALGLAAWLLASAPRHAPAPAAGGAEPGEDVVARALRLAGIDSTKKNAWVDSIPGVELGGLTAARRASFIRFANAERCTCGCGFTLAACRRFDSTCDISGPRVAALLDSVRNGWTGSTSGLRPPP